MNHEASGRSRVLDSLPADIRDALSEQMEEVLILQSTRAAENRNAPRRPPRDRVWRLPPR
ncbi:hypothetical protein IOD13_12670 [Brevibacterium casei]|nr:hypothetical protein [Brevibacterium casei]